MSSVYLDYNGSAPPDPQVVAAVAEALASGVGNASASHGPGLMQAARVAQARELVASLVGADPRGVVFTAGATEANNLALRGLAEGRQGSGRTRLLVSSVEHASVRKTARWLASNGQVELDVIPVTPGGYVDVDAAAELIGPDVVAVSVMAANSETGVLNDVASVAALAHEAGAVMHCDATQAVGRVPFSLQSSGVDLVSLSAHKICGPGGVGALVGDHRLLRSLEPVVHGGGHERGLRSGSLNVAGIVGFGVAAALAEQLREAEAARLEVLRDRLVTELADRVGGLEQNGDVNRRLANTVNVRFVGADGEAVMANLDRLAVSSGSACSSGAIEPSPVLLAMGLEREAADQSLRLSLGRFTTDEEIDVAVEELAAAVGFVRDMSCEVVR